ncbi:MAG: efflux RND transporter periplasmic adaptor subunit [Candidatus Bruticola sp.]
MNFSRKFTFYATAVALGLSLMVSGCSGDTAKSQGGGSAETASSNSSSADKSKGDSKEAAAPAAPAPAVNAVKVGTVEQKFTREWPAELKYSSTVDVKARVVGTLQDFSFKEGFKVNAGQVIFRIDDAPYVAALQGAQAQVSQCQADLDYAKAQVDVRRAEADLSSAKADLVRAQQDVDRYKPLAANGVIPTQTLDNAVAQRDVAQARVDSAQATLHNTELSSRAKIEVAKANLEAAQAQVTQANLNIGYCTITSPITGVIGEINVYPGNLVGQTGSQQVLVTISSLDPIYCNFSLSEKEYLYMMEHRGSGEVDFNLVLSDGSVYKHSGSFSMLSRSLDAKSGTITVRISFPNPERLLREGQFGRLRVTSRASEKVLVVPQKAVSTVQSDHSVYVIGANNIVESRNITIGDALGTDFIVKSGLKPGEIVIVDGLTKVQAGSACDPTITSGNAEDSSVQS